MLDHLGLTTFETYALWAVLGVAILGLLYALFLRREVLKEDTGTPKCAKCGMRSVRARMHT